MILATIKELALKAGVSKSTVSRVINNDPNVKDETRKHVLKIIKELDYKPNILARSMVTGSLPIVLIIVGDIQNHYFAKTVVGIERELTERNYMAVVYNSMYDVEREKKFIRMAKESRFSGIIPMTAVKNDDLEACLEDIDCPVVLINKDLKRKSLDAVFGNDFEAGYLSTQELINNGHKHIAYISGPYKSTVSAERERGYREALKDNEIEIDENIIFRGKLDIQSGYEIGEEIFKNEKITAVSSNNFLMALGVHRCGKKLGKPVLGEFDIACNETVPELYEESGFIFAGSDLEAIGVKAAQFLMKRIEKSDEPIQKVIFSATRVVNPKAKALVL